MKIVFFILIIIYASVIFSQGRWIKIHSPTNNFLRRIVASDSNTIWAAGHNGTIIKSSDQGNSWTVLNTNTNNIIINFSVVNNQLLFAINWEFNNPPYGTYLMKSTNGGLSWQNFFFPYEYEFLQSINFFNENIGIVAGNKTYITTNGGLNWTLAQRDSDLVANLPFLDIKMLNQNYGFACGGFIDIAGVIWKTTNGGYSWKTNGISPDEIFDFIILDSLNIIALSGDPEFIYNLAFIKTTDGGNYWSYNELPFYAVSFGIDTLNRNTIWSAAGYKFLYSTNQGISWQETATPDSVAVYDLVFLNNKIGFACGQNGALLKYIQDENFLEKQEIVHSDFALYQNYPNPFNSSTIISWQSPVSSWQTIKLYNCLGEEIDTIVNGYYESGKHSTFYILNSTLSTGVYFYQLRIGDYVETKKMIYMK